MVKVSQNWTTGNVDCDRKCVPFPILIYRTTQCWLTFNNFIRVSIFNVEFFTIIFNLLPIYFCITKIWLFGNIYMLCISKIDTIIKNSLKWKKVSWNHRIRKWCMLGSKFNLCLWTDASEWPRNKYGSCKLRHLPYMIDVVRNIITIFPSQN